MPSDIRALSSAAPRTAESRRCTIRAPTGGRWESEPMAARYAIFYAPAPDDALWRFGCMVLGYDAASGRDVAPIVPPGFTPERWAQAVADPRRYGFHATLKAPFVL